MLSEEKKKDSSIKIAVRCEPADQLLSPTKVLQLTNDQSAAEM